MKQATTKNNGMAKSDIKRKRKKQRMLRGKDGMLLNHNGVDKWLIRLSQSWNCLQLIRPLKILLFRLSKLAYKCIDRIKFLLSPQTLALRASFIGFWES